MLSRRHLRVKVMQVLYAHQQSEDKDLAVADKALQHSMDRTYDLYITVLSALVALYRKAEEKSVISSQKLIPNPQEKKELDAITGNQLLQKLAANLSLRQHTEKALVDWKDEQELLSSLFKKIMDSTLLGDYIETHTGTFAQDSNFVVEIFKEFVAPYELLHEFFEEENMYWVSDIPVANTSVLKTLQSFQEKSDEYHRLLKLVKDQDDIVFARSLMRKTALNDKAYNDFISGKSTNWDSDRIALIDVLLMKMAICEFLHFSSIPVKVTINEYIELSKDFSTPKSRGFVNGILDKLVVDFKKDGKLKKTGRGLI